MIIINLSILIFLIMSKYSHNFDDAFELIIFNNHLKIVNNENLCILLSSKNNKHKFLFFYLYN